jgi:hypothetical protein
MFTTKTPVAAHDAVAAPTASPGPVELSAEQLLQVAGGGFVLNEIIIPKSGFILSE